MGILDKIKKSVEEYKAKAPERQKAEIAKLKFETQKAELQSRQLKAQSKLRQLRQAQYNNMGSSGFQIGGQIGGFNEPMKKPKKKKHKTITINL